MFIRTDFAIPEIYAFMKENKNDQKPLLTGSSDDQASSSKSFLGLTNTKVKSVFFVLTETEKNDS